MGIKVGFQGKMIGMYAIFVLVAAFVLGFGYYKYGVRQYEKGEEKNLKVISEQVVSQFDEIVKPMELTTSYILSDANILASIRMIGMTEERDIGREYLKNAEATIQSGLSTDFIMNNFYRVIVFNESGNIVSSKSNGRVSAAKSVVDVEGMPWIKKAKEGLGEPVLVNKHEDIWGLKNNPQVFSLLKAVQGNHMGYIEVQREVIELNDLIQLPREELEVVIFLNGKEFLYSNIEKIEAKEYVPIALSKKEQVNTHAIKSEKTKKLIAKSYSKKYNATVLVMENSEEISKNSNYIAPMTFLIVACFFIISMVFVVILSQFLTKPIRELKVVMEHTKIDNLSEDIIVPVSYDEIEALSNSYQRLLERLQKSIVDERKMSMLQVQAQFDSLQSQVNPHFLYNVLNVISSRGMSSGDEMICEICGSLAAMLRYSTNNVDRYATIRDELDYLDEYFYLLKARYDYKLEYTIEVEESIVDQTLPKITLQQIVENCINHGFEKSVKKMYVHISGWQENGKWFIKITDNGQGFSKEEKEKLEKKLIETRKKILTEKNNMEMEIGGMGLVNTYARLLIIYNEEMIFEIGNGKNGAEVIIGAKMNEGENGNV